MHLVFIGAHPDDETFASGTIAKYVSRGHQATIVQATKGGKGHWEIPPDELMTIRVKEMESAAKILGAQVEFLDLGLKHTPRRCGTRDFCRGLPGAKTGYSAYIPPSGLQGRP